MFWYPFREDFSDFGGSRTRGTKLCLTENSIIMKGFTWWVRWFEAIVKNVVPKPAKFVILGVSGEPRGNFSKSSFGESWGPDLMFWGNSG